MSGTAHSWSPPLAIAATVLLWSPAPVAGAVALEDILRSTAVTPPARVCFVEERRNALLREPLIITGYLEYLGDGTLGKVVLAPFAETFVLEDGIIEVSRDGETRRISLRQGRALVAMLNGIEALLAGDTSVLQRVFETEVSGSADDWTLALQPASQRMRKHLQRITVSGVATAITSIRFELENGERHLMRIGSRDVEDCGARSNGATPGNE